MTRAVTSRRPATLERSALAAVRSMKYSTTGFAASTAVRHASGSVLISSSGSFPAGIRITRTLLTVW